MLRKIQDAEPVAKARKDDVVRIPSPEASEYLIRREVSLSREIDRTLNQLERIQRQRRGQPALPRIDVNVSTGA